jgi:hypothetical protein
MGTDTELPNARSPHGDAICPTCRAIIASAQNVVVRDGFMLHLACVVEYDLAHADAAPVPPK